MSVEETTISNVVPIPARLSQRGNGDNRRRLVSLTGDFIKPANNQTREDLARFHISTVNLMARAVLKRELNATELGRLESVAKGSADASSESILREVLVEAAKMEVIGNADALSKQFKDNNLNEKDYHDFARAGLTFGSFSAMLAALQKFNLARASGTYASVEEWAAKTGNGSGSYPSMVGGTPYRDVGTASVTMFSNYGMNAATTQQLWNMGVRSDKQYERVVNDVASIGLGGDKSKPNPRFLNSVAPDVAKLRTAEGDKTDEHLAEVKRNQEEFKRIVEEMVKAEKAGDEARVAQLRQELQRNNDKTNSYVQEKVQTPEGRQAITSIVPKAQEEAISALRTQNPDSKVMKELGNQFAADVKKVQSSDIQLEQLVQAKIVEAKGSDQSTGIKTVEAAVVKSQADKTAAQDQAMSGFAAGTDTEPKPAVDAKATATEPSGTKVVKAETAQTGLPKDTKITSTKSVAALKT